MIIKKFNQYIKESNNFSVDPYDAYYEIVDILDSYNINYDVIDGTKGEYSDDSDPAWIFVVNFKGNEYKIQLFYYEDVIDSNEWLRNIFIDIYDPIEDDNIRISYKSELIDFFKSKIDVVHVFKKINNNQMLNYNQFKSNESINIDKLRGKLPFPEQWPEEVVETDNIITKILDIFKIKYIRYVNPNALISINSNAYNVDYSTIEIPFKNQDIFTLDVYYDLGTNRGDLGSSVYVSSDFNDYNGDEISDPYDLIDFLYEHGFINYSKWANKVNECVNLDKKTFNKFNEALSEEQIMKNKSTTFDEKEDQVIKLRLKELEEYNKMKTRMENQLKDLDNDIDYITINKMIGGNPFLKQYVMLLSKKRELDLIDKQIEQKEELIESTKNEYEGSNNDQRKDLMDQVRGYESEIKELQQKRSEYSKIDQMLQKWDSQILRMRRDLKQGKSVLTSTLSWLR